MTTEALAFISESLETVGINYALIQYNSEVALNEAYWVGEYNEIPPISEDGMDETTFILTGTVKGSWMDLEDQKEKIKALFPKNSGKQAVLENGSRIAIFYVNSMPVPTGDNSLKRLQINLITKEWKGEQT